MLHELLAAYLQRIHHVVSRCSGAHVEHYTEEILTPERVNLRIRIRLGRGHLVEISEAVVVEADRLVPSTTDTTARTSRIAWCSATTARGTFPASPVPSPQACARRRVAVDQARHRAGSDGGRASRTWRALTGAMGVRAGTEPAASHKPDPTARAGRSS